MRYNNMNRNYYQKGGQIVSSDEAYDKLKTNYPELSEEDILQIIMNLQQETDNETDLQTMQRGGMMMNREETEDQDGGMALGQIRSMQERLARLQQMIRPNSDLEPWVASKLTLADDYLSTVNDYMTYNPEQTGEEEYEEYDEEMMNPQMSQEAMMMMQQDVPMEMRYGGMTRYAEGGGIPARYKNMGFTKVGAKRQSTRPGKKWMVLAKKGSDYKVVHGGYKGMKDFTQHHSEKRRDNFWNRMGGKNSSKATDPFSPLYWHKRFGTWREGGNLHNTNSLSNVDNVDYIENMKRGGMFNLAKARVLYRKGINNFDQRNAYQTSGYIPLNEKELQYLSHQMSSNPITNIANTISPGGWDYYDPIFGNKKVLTPKERQQLNEYMGNRSLGTRLYDLIPFVGPSLPKGSRLIDEEGLRRSAFMEDNKKYKEVLRELEEKGYATGGYINNSMSLIEKNRRLRNRKP